MFQQHHWTSYKQYFKFSIYVLRANTVLACKSLGAKGFFSGTGY